jgi:Alpha/beta hydrolase domain
MRLSLSTSLRRLLVASAVTAASTQMVPMAHAAVSQAALQLLTQAGYGARADVEHLSEKGFVEQQFIMSGNAQKYKASGTWANDGKWGATVVSNANPYQTAVIVRRPADPAKFNGVVLVEWLNVSTGYPLDVDWGMDREAILREGYAYVGVNTQKVGIEGIQKLKQYGTLYANAAIADDKLSYDIMSQVGKAVREQAATLLGPLQPKVVIATGHSQSAGALITYANAVQPIEGIFDGIFIHGRSNSGLKLSTSDSLPGTTALRSDTKVPIFMIQSEMDVSLMAPATSKQIDTNMLRHWEVAGTSHADQYLLDNIGLVSTREVNWTPPACSSAYNATPFYMAQIAAVHHLKEWITHGTVPPVAPRMQRDFFGSIKKDANGNAIGGLRLPELEAPVAKYGHANFTTGSLAFLDLFACVAGGSTTPFAASKLATLYPTHADYVSKYTAAADAAVAKGYIRPVDRDNAVFRAKQAAIPK